MREAYRSAESNAPYSSGDARAASRSSALRLFGRKNRYDQSPSSPYPPLFTTSR